MSKWRLWQKDVSKKGHTAQHVRLRKGLLWAALIIFVAISIYRFVRPLNPTEVRNATIKAIALRDASKLVELCHPDEIRRIGITTEAVHKLLDETFWKPGARPIGDYAVQDMAGDTPVDIAEFPAYLRSATANGSARFVITANDSRDFGWRLNLTWLFFTYLKMDADDIAGRQTYLNVSRQFGLKGMIDSRGQFNELSAIEAKIQSLKPAPQE